MIIGFDPNVYSASEDEQNPPTIVVRVIQGTLHRNVVVTFSTTDNTAMGQFG